MTPVRYYRCRYLPQCRYFNKTVGHSSPSNPFLFISLPVPTFLIQYSFHFTFKLIFFLFYYFFFLYFLFNAYRIQFWAKHKNFKFYRSYTTKDLRVMIKQLAQFCLHHLLDVQNSIKWITFRIQSYVVLEFFCINLLHVLTMGSIGSSLFRIIYTCYIFFNQFSL